MGASVYTAKQPTSRFAGNLIVYAAVILGTLLQTLKYMIYQILPATESGVDAGKTLLKL